MSIFKKIGNAFKKVAKVALPLAAGGAAAYFGGPALGSAIGGLFGGGNSPSAGAGIEESQGGLPPQSGSAFSLKDVPWNTVGSVASGAMNYVGQQQTNAANAQQAQKQMDFQAEQTGSAYQRGTADMKAAGLNPMLAYSQGGAQSGGGAQATMGNELGSGANSAMSTAQILQGMDRVSAEIGQTQAATDQTRAQTRNTDADTLDKLLQPGFTTEKKLGQERENTIKYIMGDMLARDNYVNEQTVAARIASAKAGATKESNLATKEGHASNILGYEERRAKNEGQAEDSWWKRNVSPYLGDVGAVTGSAASASRLFR
ncbi:MAG: DNA pilot protein [Microvirus sp.]|nr:MAG: DNA pilot protein [Microvirus sp.]